MQFEGIPFAMEEILFDPQTSGGLLLAVPAEQAEKLCLALQKIQPQTAIVGEILPRLQKEIYVK